MSDIIIKRLGLFFVVFAGLMTFSCTQHTIPDYSDVASCVGCHTNYAHLKDVYSPDTVAPAGGCGGEAPHYEPYDRVFLGGDGYTAFKADFGHGELSCTFCHNGINGTHEKEIAHSGNFLKHPSDDYTNKCGGCHQEIAKDFASSLHNGIGQKRKVTMRSGLSGYEDFDLLEHQKIEGYNANCATCHGTCGNCHVNRPPIGGGGLMDGHKFTRNPDMKKTCITCHTSRGGHAYLGVAAGTEPDSHLKNMGFECMDCHTGHELHGDSAKPAEHRYAYEHLPSCDDCHSGIESSNKYHSKHYDDFNCQVCHSQDYNNCASCHVHGDGARVPSYLDFKIAKNPIPDTKADFEFVLVRRTLTAPDNWSAYGVPDYENHAAFPSYNYTSPHNILKYTSRTADSATVEDQEASAIFADMNCTSNCHIRTEADGVYNKELYLFESDMVLGQWEIDANADIVVDGALPGGWFVVK